MNERFDDFIEGCDDDIDELSVEDSFVFSVIFIEEVFYVFQERQGIIFVEKMHVVFVLHDFYEFDDIGTDDFFENFVLQSIITDLLLG